MEGLAELFESAVQNNKPSSKRASKRKWREIESIKEKYRLRDELKDIDPSMEYDLAELDF
ncbi:DUF3545 family protein [Psychrosphaera sp. B3R10]|uniref:DUF3545 family protein n=1 Tax=Psychrosphaera algicola TaxID=3023714 RepID=A0ABT5FHF3_9GAMM|nr:MULTISPECIES: DUF3545 family protein [unclassified Psychrosphaera]MBU2882981.1 DUF3545 family protein [Psychrosphaera sp. I2R16]MBU2991378.1 DUF3545 family protein [Psychrosphaera sp. B3R10]MDC2890617.1 DUF3545 family protein [Psychrosphaera sp. G1-22]MDO6720267.1 DUF3545 family protein [Psychrosphaera sp. 1_MG-2023]